MAALQGCKVEVTLYRVEIFFLSFVYFRM